MDTESKRVKIADLSLLFVALLWGIGFTAVQLCIDAGMPTSLILAIRFSLGALLVLAFRFKTIVKMNRAEFITGMIAGLLLFFSFFAQTLGQQYTSVSNSAFITAIYVVIVPFIAWIVRKKPPKLKMFILVFTTLAGVAVLTYTPGQSFLSFKAGDIFLLLCAIGFAAHIVYLGVKAKDFEPTRITFMQLITSALLGIIMFLVSDISVIADTNWGLGLPAIAYLGVFSTAVCYFLQTWAQTITTPSKAAIIMSMESLLGPMFAMIFGLDVFRINIVIGGAIIMGSVILSELDFSLIKGKEPA